MNKLLVPMAYKYVALALMLAEINYCASKLCLPTHLPVTQKALCVEHLSRPLLVGFGGTLETEDFAFIFFQSGRLRQIVRLNLVQDLWKAEVQRKLADMKSLINSNGAYMLATNWLAAIAVDVSVLESNYPPSVQQRFCFSGTNSLGPRRIDGNGIILLPIFHVSWGDVAKPAVMVSIFGPTKELLGIYQYNESFSHRPSRLLKNVDELLKIKDTEFMKYSEEQRIRLVSRFAAFTYAPVTPNGTETGTDLHGSTTHDGRTTDDSWAIRDQKSK